MRACAWCRGPIRAAARRDALCCSVRCRQARHRFTRGVGVGSGSATEPLRLAYADPPYPGKAWLYRGHPDYAGEVDHDELIRRLSTYDGWALSTSAEALPAVLASCPPGVRVGAWFRGERPTRSARPLTAWEAVVYFGGRGVVVEDLRTRREELDDGSQLQVRRVGSAGGTGRVAIDDGSRVDGRRLDALVYVSRPRTTDPMRVVGAKPAVFCRWVFDLLGAQAGDEFVDVFPGSGGVGRAWRTYVGGVAA